MAAQIPTGAPADIDADAGVLGVIDHGAGQSHLSVFSYNRFGELTPAGAIITIGVPTPMAWRFFVTRSGPEVGVDMRARRWIGWIVTGLMAVLMLLSAVPDVLQIPDALVVFRHLGYPPYLLLFLGTAKTLGVVAVLIPGLPRLKEWAFAGLTFDLTGALYSHLSVGDPASAWTPAVVALVLVAASYVAYRSNEAGPDS